MATECKQCRGTGKARILAVIGEVAPDGQSAAREKILAFAAPADMVICGTDFAQMVCAEAGLSHVRERDKTVAELKAGSDDALDLAAPPPPPPAPKQDTKKAATAAATPATPAAASTK